MDTHRLERIQLLSARFHELHGLIVAFAGATLAGAMGCYLLATTQPSNNGALIVAGLSFVLMIPAVWWLKRYYTRTFGRQVAVRRPFPWPLLAYFLVAQMLNTHVPSIPAGAPTAATVALLSVWVAVRDWPWRAYYLGAPAAVSLAFAWTSSGGGTLDPGLTLAVLFLALGASFVPIGGLDHLLLVRLLREVREPQVATVAEPDRR